MSLSKFFYLLLIATLFPNLSAYADNFGNHLRIKETDVCAEIVAAQSEKSEWLSYPSSNFQQMPLEYAKEFSEDSLYSNVLWVESDLLNKSYSTSRIHLRLAGKKSQSSNFQFLETGVTLRTESNFQDETYMAVSARMIFVIDNNSPNVETIVSARTARGEPNPIHYGIFYLSPEGMIPAADRVLDCRKIDQVEPKKMESGICYWIDGAKARTPSGKRYCW